MDPVSFLDDQNVTSMFYPLEEKLSLPFPLNLHFGWRIMITLTQLLTLIFGIKLRAIIFSYLLCPESKMGPIDSLIWMDQMTGVFLAVGIILRMCAINSPVPLSQIFGTNFCKWIGLPSILYVCGDIIWNCLIALYRYFIESVINENLNASQVAIDWRWYDCLLRTWQV